MFTFVNERRVASATRSSASSIVRTRTSSKTSPLVIDARSENFPWTS